MFPPAEYIGRVLGCGFSDRLQNRVTECIRALSGMDSLCPAVIPYLSAWNESEKKIWYEFLGKGFTDLLMCAPDEAVASLRNALADRRVYHHTSQEKNIREEVATREELNSRRDELRNEGKRMGSVDAVYKLVLSDNRVVWLKDQANIEVFDHDGICLSVGFLTDVSKEMEQKDLFEKIRYFDELTGLPKRSIMERVFEVNIGNLKRRHVEDFVFLLIDVDHFKPINDTYGHQAGDHILTCLAEVIMSIKRKEDEIGRYGGEEFYGFSTGDMNQGLLFAERLRKKVENHGFLYDGVEIHVTVSIGVAVASQVEKKGLVLSAENIIGLADKMLYVAKQNGRNKVVWQDNP